jgi:general stress protein YciG
MSEEVKEKKPRGFAALTREHVQQIAQMGGRAAHAAGKAYRYTSDKAREAGKKGGQATAAKRRAAREASSSAEPKSDGT